MREEGIQASIVYQPLIIEQVIFICKAGLRQAICHHASFFEADSIHDLFSVQQNYFSYLALSAIWRFMYL